MTKKKKHRKLKEDENEPYMVDVDDCEMSHNYHVSNKTFPRN